MNFLRKHMKLSIRTKLTLLIESFVILLVLIAGFVVTVREKETLESELRKRGLALTSELSEFIVKPLLSQDAPTLRRFVNHTMGQDYVRYVIVLGPRGRVIMHSDLSEVGKRYDDPLSVTAMRSAKPGFTDPKNLEDKELLCDMFSPVHVSGIRLGTIRLGYSHAAVEKEITQARRQVFLMGLLIASAGWIVAYLLAVFISSPIQQIIEATEKVATGNLDARLMIRRGDEIGILANTFNKMTDDLRRTTVSKEYFDNIIESMNDTLIVVDPDMKIRRVNKATCELLGYKKEEMSGADMNLILPEVTKILKVTAGTGPTPDSTVVNYETDYVTSSGELIPMLLSAAMLRNKDGKTEGVVCIARDVTELHKAEEALRRSEKELHFLSSQLLTAQEKERKRLSIELHDELGQSLMVLKLNIRSIFEGLPSGQDTLRAGCDDAMRYLNEITENVRRLARDLSPSILEDLGFSAAIRRLAHTFAKHSRIQCSLDLEDVDGLFSAEEQITLYRMFQECLTNVAKHAQATKVSLAIRKQGHNVVFCVEDNGKGFDVHEAVGRSPGGKGLGLAALHQRTRMLGGSLDIRSRKGAGTTIALSIPLAIGV